MFFLRGPTPPHLPKLAFSPKLCCSHSLIILQRAGLLNCSKIAHLGKPALDNLVGTTLQSDCSHLVIWIYNLTAVRSSNIPQPGLFFTFAQSNMTTSIIAFCNTALKNIATLVGREHCPRLLATMLSFFHICRRIRIVPDWL